MASKREGLRPVRPKSPPRQRKSNAERCKDYRTRVKADPARLANFKSTKSLAHAHWVARRTEEQKEIDKVNARLRQQNKSAGKFILARIGATQGRRTIQKEYGAVVLQSQGNELEVRFLREKDGHYHFPEIEDDAWVDKENVVRNLDTSLLANRVLN